MENFEKRMANNAESNESQHLEEVKKDERLSNKEALLYQEYATKLEGKEFNEQASIESYSEAEKVINKLKDSNFDWMNIDWDNIDKNDLDNIISLEKHLDVTTRIVAKKEKDGLLTKISEKMKGITMPLILSASILSTLPNVSNAQDVVGEVEKNLSEFQGEELKYAPFEKTTRVDFVDYGNTVVEWAAETPKAKDMIERLIIDSIDYSDVTISHGKDNDIIKVTTEAEIIVLTKDKRAIVVKGFYTYETATEDSIIVDFLESAGIDLNRQKSNDQTPAKIEAVKAALGKIEAQL